MDGIFSLFFVSLLVGAIPTLVIYLFIRQSHPDIRRRRVFAVSFILSFIGALLFLQNDLGRFSNSSPTTASSSRIASQTRQSISADAVSPASLLERVTLLGGSTRLNFSEFVDEGGLDKNPAWHDFYVEEVEIAYEGDLVKAARLKVTRFAKYLEHAEMWISGEVASPRQIRQGLSRICGVGENDWKIDNDAGVASRPYKGKTLRCMYSGSVNNILMSWEP